MLFRSELEKLNNERKLQEENSLKQIQDLTEKLKNTRTQLLELQRSYVNKDTPPPQHLPEDQAKITNLNKSLNKMTQELDNSKQQLNNYMNENKRLNNDIIDHKKRITELERKNSDLESKLMNIQHEFHNRIEEKKEVNYSKIKQSTEAVLLTETGSVSGIGFDSIKHREENVGSEAREISEEINKEEIFSPESGSTALIEKTQVKQDKEDLYEHDTQNIIDQKEENGIPIKENSGDQQIFEEEESKEAKPIISTNPIEEFPPINDTDGFFDSIAQSMDSSSSIHQTQSLTTTIQPSQSQLNSSKRSVVPDNLF